MKIRKMKRWRFTYGKGRTRSVAVRYRKPAYKNPNTTEVKHKTISQSATTAAIQYISTNSTTLFTVQQANIGDSNIQGALSTITLGTAKQNRIGTRIFVKSISLKCMAWICPASTDADHYSTVGIRWIVHNAPSSNQQTVDYFWTSTTNNHLMDYVDRTRWNVYKDKLTILNTGYPLQGTRSTPGGEGNLRVIKMRIPINRHVEYTYEGSIKNDRDIINLAVYGWSPGDPDNTTQIACYNWVCRIYFTDS